MKSISGRNKSRVPFFAYDPTEPRFWDLIPYDKWKGYVDNLLFYSSGIKGLGAKMLFDYWNFHAFKDKIKDYNVDALAEARDGEVVFQYKHSEITSTNRINQVKEIVKNAKNGANYKTMRNPSTPDETRAKDIWKNVKYYVGVTNVEIGTKNFKVIRNELEKVVQNQFQTYLLHADDLANLATHPSFLWQTVSKTKAKLTKFWSIEDILMYEKWDDEPKCFREDLGFKHLGVDFGPVPPYFKQPKQHGVFVPQSWKNVLKGLDDGKEIAWMIEPASTGKTTFGLWLGHSWRVKHPDWAVLYLDAREHSPPDKVLRGLLADLQQARAFPLFIIFDNLHAWHKNAGWVLNMLQLPPGTKCIFLSRPATGINEIQQVHSTKHKNILKVTLSSEDYVKEVIRRYIQQARTDLLEYPSLEEKMLKVFKHDLIAIYYALQKMGPEITISEDLAAEGYWKRISNELLHKTDCPNPEDSLAALMVVTALYRFEIPTREGFVLDYLGIDLSILNWLVENGWIWRDKLHIGAGSPSPHLRFAHESSARVFVRTCELFKDDLPPKALAKICLTVDKISWRNAVLAEYKVREELDLNSLIFRDLPELPEVLDDCIAYIRSKYPLKKETLCELLLVWGSAARRRGSGEALEVAAKCFEEARTLFGEAPLLGKVRKGWLLYDMGMLKFYRNDPGALEEFQESVQREREINNKDKALMSEAAYWAVYARLLPSKERLTTARKELSLILEKLQNEEKKLSSKGQLLEVMQRKNDVKRWIANCQAHIAELSVDLEDDQEVPLLIEKARRIIVELGQMWSLPVLKFIEGKYFLRKQPERACKLLEEVVDFYRDHKREERISEIWVALGDAYKLLSHTDKARDWYIKAKNHNGLASNAIGKQLGEERLRGMLKG